MTIQYNMYYGTYYIEYNVLKVKATILGHQLVDAYFVPLMESIVTRMYFFTFFNKIHAMLSVE